MRIPKHPLHVSMCKCKDLSAVFEPIKFIQPFGPDLYLNMAVSSDGMPSQWTDSRHDIFSSSMDTEQQPPPVTDTNTVIPTRTWATVSRNTEGFKYIFVDFEPSSNYNITDKELARFIFSKLKMPRNKVRSIEMNLIWRLCLEVSKDFDEITLPLHEAHEIRRSLMTTAKVNFQHAWVWVKVYRTTIFDEEEAILNVLRPFGRFTSNLVRMTYQKREGSSEEAKILNWICIFWNGDWKLYITTEIIHQNKQTYPSSGVKQGLHQRQKEAPKEIVW